MYLYPLESGGSTGTLPIIMQSTEAYPPFLGRIPTPASFQRVFANSMYWQTLFKPARSLPPRNKSSSPMAIEVPFRTHYNRNRHRFHVEQRPPVGFLSRRHRECRLVNDPGLFLHRIRCSLSATGVLHAWLRSLSPLLHRPLLSQEHDSFSPLLCVTECAD